MKPALMIFTSIGTIISTAFSSSFEDAAREYEKDVNTVNEQLSAFQRDSTFCPGAGLALSCGDANCETEKSENEITCPSDCSNALLNSYNFQTFCGDVKAILKPETYAEIQEAVKKAAAENMHVRVVGKAHSTNAQLCTDGIVISTEKLNRILGLEQFEGYESVLVEPGVTEKELTEWLHARGKSIGYGLVGFRGISLGGMIATGTHGSSPKHSAMLSSAVQSVLVATADGKLSEFSENASEKDLFKAMRANLGMLGVVVQMRIKVRPQFNLDTTINFETDEVMLQKGPIDLVKHCDFGQIHWFPSTKKIMKTCGKETSQQAEAGAENIYLNPYVPTSLVTPYKVAFHYGACNPTFNALFEKLRFTISRWQPPLVKQNSRGELVNSEHVIGPSHRMLSSELGFGRETLIVRDWEVAVPEQQVSQALLALKNYMKINNMSLPITGLYLRFTPVEETTLISNAVPDGHFKKGELVTFFEFIAYYPVGFAPEERDRYSRLYQQMAQLLIEQFHARPHWGKNNEAIFKTHKDSGLQKHLLELFNHWVITLDPNGLFSNDFRKLIFDPNISVHDAIELNTVKYQSRDSVTIDKKY